MSSYITLWRLERYKREIKNGKKEAILKFINSKENAKRKIFDIIQEIKQLNKPLWDKFLEEMLERAAELELIRGKVSYRELGLRRKGVEILRYYVEGNTKEYQKAKKVVLKKIEICRRLQSLGMYNYSLRRLVRPSKFLKKAKQSIDAIISAFEEELKEEIKLSKQILSPEEIEYLKQSVLEKLKRIDLS